MDQLRAMRVFTRVIDEGGFAAAARVLDLAPAVVTRVIADLEQHLGARLIHRTTRRIALTEVGDIYLERARQILLDVAEAETLAGLATSDARGHVRVQVAPAFAVHQLAKRLPRFRKAYPLVSLEITANGPVDTLDEHHDLAIIMARQPLAGEFVARRLARSEFIVCASPEYLDQRGRPQEPRDLKSHDALIPPISAVQRGLTFYRGAYGDDEPVGDSVTLQVTRPLLATLNIDLNYASALAGLGVAGLPSFVVEDALLESALERVMPEWRLFDVSIWACMPSRKLVPARVRAFMDFLLQEFGGEDKDPWLVTAGCASPPSPEALSEPQS